MPEYSFTDEHTVAHIADHTPRALSAYFYVLHNIGFKNEITITKNEIVHGQQKSWTKFKNDLRALARLFVINFFDDGESVMVSIIESEECA